jgi:hypothetical protein
MAVWREVMLVAPFSLIIPMLLPWVCKVDGSYLPLVVTVCADTEIDLLGVAVCLESFRDAYRSTISTCNVTINQLA